MGLFSPIARALGRNEPPIPTYQPITFASIAAALDAIGQADATGGHIALRIARAFAVETAQRLGLTERGVWESVLTLPAEWIGCLWDGSWDALACELFGPSGIDAQPTLH